VPATTDRFRRTAAWTTAHGQAALLAVTLSGLGGGALAHLLAAPQSAKTLWSAAVVVGIGCSLWWTAQSIHRRQLGVDAIALLALIGTLAVGDLQVMPERVERRRIATQIPPYNPDVEPDDSQAGRA